MMIHILVLEYVHVRRWKSSFSTEDKDEEEETQQRTVKEEELEEYDHPWITHNATQNLKETS